ncbi:hypothetical protein [Microbispora triticiradicis]|uniref:hypothetical protein n=1 Tax=Microbispora triticiradicis TaxID=2200763 RepID=UPI001AD6BC71|nr:hypothetical protein [Microbispora triticiradicis]
MAMTLVLTQAQFEALRREAERKGRTVQQIVAAAVEEYLARHDHEGDDEDTGS